MMAIMSPDATWMISSRGWKESSPMNSVSTASRSCSRSRSQRASSPASSRMYSASAGRFVTGPHQYLRGVKTPERDRRQLGHRDMRGLYAGCPGWATSGRAVCLRARRGRWRDGEKAAYLRRNGLESSPVKPVTVSNSIPFLPSGTVTVIVLSSTWVNLAAPPGPKETMLTHPGSPKCSPAIVTLSPVLPSSGVTFLILGVAPEQLLPFVSRGDSEALALLLWIPPPGCAVAGASLAFSFLDSSAATARPTWPAKANAARMPRIRTVPMIHIEPSPCKWNE